MDLRGFRHRALRLRVMALAFGVLFFSSLEAVAAPKSQLRVVVLPFENHSKDPELQPLEKGLADMVTTDLSNSPSLVVVEREKLRELLSELKIQRSKYFDPSTRSKIGKGTAANFMVAGSFDLAKGQLQLEMRLIDITKGTVDFSSRVRGAKDSIFDLEEELVSKFLKRLGYRFTPLSVPRARKEQMAILLEYSKGLNLIDDGQGDAAAATFGALVSKAPTFGMARKRLTELRAKQGELQTSRRELLSAKTEEAFAKARKYLATSKLENLTRKEAARYLAYRRILGYEIALGMKRAFRFGPRKEPIVYTLPPKSKPGRKLALAYAAWLQTLLAETEALLLKHPHLTPDLPFEEDRELDALGLEVRNRDALELLTDYVLLGKFRLGERNVRMQPYLAHLDPKLGKKVESWALRKARDKNIRNTSAISLYESVADYHFGMGDKETGVKILQEAMDRFPTAYRWKYLDKRVKEELGLVRSNRNRDIDKYQEGLRDCSFMPLNIGMPAMMSRRAKKVGIKALESVEKEVVGKCKGTPKFSQIQAFLYNDMFLKAASWGFCSEFDRYSAKWVALGESARDAAAYRKNYSNCPAP